ncbi:MAG TPA: hypothetical protein VGD91_13330 [Trebonia sp.]
MAGSGPYAPIGGGWISGACSWYDKQKERRGKFLAEHPDWEIYRIRSVNRWEASNGDTDTELSILQDEHLASLLDRLEARFPKDEKAPDE